MTMLVENCRASNICIDLNHIVPKNYESADPGHMGSDQAERQKFLSTS